MVKWSKRHFYGKVPHKKHTLVCPFCNAKFSYKQWGYNYHWMKPKNRLDIRSCFIKINGTSPPKYYCTKCKIYFIPKGQSQKKKELLNTKYDQQDSLEKKPKKDY